MTRGRARKPLTENEKRELEVEARVRHIIDSTHVWMVVPPSMSHDPMKRNVIRLRRHNVAEVHSHEFLSNPPVPAPAIASHPIEALAHTSFQANPTLQDQSDSSAVMPTSSVAGVEGEQQPAMPTTSVDIPV
jgi:hypothetical protein